MLDHVELILKSSEIEYEVLIDNVQEAINKENTPLTQQMQIDLAGRKGLKLLLQY